jgi:hypothetical protein
MLISAYIRFKRRFSSAIAFSSEIIEASIARQVLLSSPRGHATKLSPPIVKAGVAHTVFSAKFRNRHTGLDLLQNTHILCVTVSFILYQNLLRYYAEKILRLNTTNLRRITKTSSRRCLTEPLSGQY